MTKNAETKPKQESAGEHPFVCVEKKKFVDGDVVTIVYFNVWPETGAVRLRMEQLRNYVHRYDKEARSFGPEDMDDLVRGIWKAKGWMKTRQRRFRLSDLFALFK